MYSEALKQLIDAALTDGVITEQERQVIKKKAMSENIDPDEIDVYLDSEIQKINIKKQQSTGIIKCPMCGEVVPPLTGVCPACGHTITFSNDSNQSTSLLSLKSKLDGLFVQYSKKSITFVDFLILLAPYVFIIWLIYVLWKVRKSKDILAEFNQMISDGKILYGQDNNARSYFSEMEEKMNVAHKKSKKFVVIAYVLVFLDLYCLTLYL